MSRATAPIGVSHQGQFPCRDTFRLNLLPGVALSDAIKVKSRQMEQDIKMPNTIHASFAGTLQAYQQSTRHREPLLIIAALLAVYIVAGHVFYESLIHPITILSTLSAVGGRGFVAGVDDCQQNFHDEWAGRKIDLA